MKRPMIHVQLGVVNWALIWISELARPRVVAKESEKNIGEILFDLTSAVF